MSDDSFEFPPLHNFKPFFTKQANEQTLNAQLSNWSDLILAYCRHYRIWTLDLARTTSTASGDVHDGAIDGELFYNKKLDRSLKPDMVKMVFDYMVKHGHAEWHNDDTILIYFKTPQEWATSINEWVKETGHGGSVLTLYELSQGDLVTSAEFYGIDSIILKKAVDIMVQRGQAVLMKGSDGKLAGVKIL